MSATTRGARCGSCHGHGWRPGPDGFTPEDCGTCGGGGFLPAALPAAPAGEAYDLRRAAGEALAHLAMAGDSYRVGQARRVLRRALDASGPREGGGPL